jgi:nicotinate-nucleotide adenylyltransferase
MIALFGGSFDPPHHGHIQSILNLASELALEKVHLLPCAQSPLKHGTGATQSQRIAMLNLLTDAVKPSTSVELFIDDTELRLPSPSYTIDTLIHFRHRLSHHNDTNTPILFILGHDAFLSIEKWKDWQHIIQYCHLVVMPRETENNTMSSTLAQWSRNAVTTHIEALKTQPYGKVFFAKTPLITISSSEIRAMIAKQALSGEPWESPLLHPVVSEYIKENKLYLS